MYEKHTRGWERMVERETDRLEDQMDEQEDQEEENSYRRKTVDLGEMYNNINLQLSSSQIHTDDFEARVEAYEQAMEKDQKIDDDNEKKALEDSKARSIMAQGMTPDHMPEIRHPNPSVNYGEMWSGVDELTFVQVGFEHEHDFDDIVPEFTENIVVEQKHGKADTRKTDFNGEKYEEFYDE